eukprot:TCONS_00034713-protein
MNADSWIWRYWVNQQQGMRQRNVEILKKIQNLEYIAQDCHNKICLVQDAIRINIAKNPENDQNIRSIYNNRIEHLNEVLCQKLEEINQLEEESTINASCGPYFKRLDEILQSVGVQRQAYHGRSFIGNDVHKMLKVSFFSPKFKITDDKFIQNSTFHEKIYVFVTS